MHKTTMKCIYCLLTIFFMTQAMAQSNARIVVKKTGKTYRIQDEQGKRKISNLKFVKRIANYYQVLDSKNKIFYINDAFERKDSVQDHYFVCGTVPHYELSMQETDSFYLVYSDETFYDQGNQIPAERIAKIAKTEADSVLFISGQKTFNYTSNFNYLNPLIDPSTLIQVKNGKYQFVGQKNIQYDSLCFLNGFLPSLKTMKNKTYGYYNICPPQFLWIGPFKYHLARVKLRSGKMAYMDDEGKVY